MPALRGRGTEKGCPRGTLFRCLALLLLAWSLPGVAADCPADRIDERVRVRSVHDGDTLRLDDDRRIRLIGIDTPELGRDGRPHQPFAIAARDALREGVADGGGWIGLRYGEERFDRYGRTLAHVYLDDGRSAAAELLGRGLATALTVPPNVGQHGCLLAVEEDARDAGSGIWSLPAYRVRRVEDLDNRMRGFARVAGAVTGLHRSSRATWLELGPGLTLRIDHADARYLPDPEGYLGARVEVRGWLRGGRDGLQMSVRHRAALRRLDADG